VTGLWAGTAPPAAQPLIDKLNRLAPLSLDDTQMLARCSWNIRRIDADRELAVQGGRSTECHLLIEGFACCYKMLESGARQILSFQLVPTYAGSKCCCSGGWTTASAP